MDDRMHVLLLDAGANFAPGGFRHAEDSKATSAAGEKKSDSAPRDGEAKSGK